MRWTTNIADMSGFPVNPTAVFWKAYSNCGRTLPKRQPVCIYCGTDAEFRDPFGA